MNKVEITFLQDGLVKQQPGGWFVMSKTVALNFIEACRKEGIRILGVDGFYLHHIGIEPSMVNSIDFTSGSYFPESDIYTDTISFINDREADIYFEVICSEDN